MTFDNNRELFIHSNMARKKKLMKRKSIPRFQHLIKNKI